jgi:8-oxo-dGTP pyrophosphatase MutT (NUDIX family)
MPAVVSKAQYRMMQAILHGKKTSTKRGDHGPPKWAIGHYSFPDYKSLPESKGKELDGGHWGHKGDGGKYHKHGSKKEYNKHHEHHGHGKGSKRETKKEKSVKKDDSDLGWVAMILIDDNNRILLGEHSDGGLAFPGGHIDHTDANSEVAAIRETKEETGISVDIATKIWSSEGKDKGELYLAQKFTGEPKSSDELKKLKWYETQDIEWEKLRECCVEPLKYFIEKKLGKSLKGMLALEKLNKNIVRQKPEVTHEITHGDALRFIGTGLFKKIKSEVDGMSDEDFKDIKLDSYTVKIRKHMNDVYSGNVSDGHKIIYQFTNRSLPELTVALMSVFEWYLPEDEEVLDLIDEEKISDDDIHGGLSALIDNYKKHNIGNIYEEMENIRKEIRNGAAIDIQQVESRIMKLFDKLEGVVNTVIGKHNKLADLTEKELQEVTDKLRELQSKIEEMGKKPETIEAVSVHKKNPDKIHSNEYPYLPKPQIEISADGKIRITFDSEWTSLEKQNFLRDMRAKVLSRERA